MRAEKSLHFDRKWDELETRAEERRARRKVGIKHANMKRIG